MTNILTDRADSPDAAAQNSPPVTAAITDEIRFAVVMYGGSSLAIYINGVVQELFHLVRATAPANDGSKGLHRTIATGTEAVYRRLGQLLGSDQKPEMWTASDDGQPVRTRFIVDILSGTSAGGINAVFLAKALANDQEFGVLKNLWLDGGAMERLLNDEKTRKSVKDPTLKQDKTPQSLLNSQQMYRLIYNALREMETGNPNANGFRSPYMEELDLFVTRTDIKGQPVPVRLANDTVVSDLRHRDVLHFQYAEWLQGISISSDLLGNDFLGKNDPFLAYAARCTSAFPIAFEPMTLDAVKPLADKNTEGFDTSLKRWSRFFAKAPEKIGDPVGQQIAEMRTSPFTDGGVLDNKPFGYAIDTLRKRWSDKSVQRKLIYIEPAPQPLRQTQQSSDEDEQTLCPDPLDVAGAALLTLPSYEAIHSDLQRVLDRNAVIKRLNEVLRGVEKDAAAVTNLDWSQGWQSRSYTAIVEERGIAYGAYHRLKIQAVTDALANILACQMGFKGGSEHIGELLRLVGYWRDAYYVSESRQDSLNEDRANFQDSGNFVTEADKGTEPEFLRSFDLDYRLRRLLFLRSKLNDALKHSAKEALEPLSDSDLEQLLANAERLREAKDNLKTIFLGMRHGTYELTTDRSEQTGGQSRQFTKLRQYILGTVAAKGQGATAERMIPPILDALVWADLDGIIGSVKEDIRTITKSVPNDNRKSSSKNVEANLMDLGPPKNKDQFQRYASNYEVYDSVIFPALYGTGVGETSLVDLVRISPLDAISLRDENKPGPRKLAGTALGNFGALLERSWRWNDIMWGRLDAAECLIKTLLPKTIPERERNALIADLLQQAQEAIVAEEMAAKNKEAVVGWLMALLPQLSGDDASGAKKIEQVVADSRNESKGDVRKPVPVPTPDEKERVTQKLTRIFKERRKRLGDTGLDVRPVFELCLTPKQLIAYLKNGYEIEKPTAKSALEIASRSSAIFAKILNGVAVKRQVNAPIFALLPRIGQTFASIVEVAMPHTILRGLVQHWLQLIYLIEAFLILTGTALGQPQMASLGWNTLLITAAAHLLITYLNSVIRGKNIAARFLWIFSIVFLTVVVGLAALGFPVARAGVTKWVNCTLHHDANCKS